MYYADHFNDKIKVKQKSDCCDQDGSIAEEFRLLSLFRIRLTVPEFAVEEYVFMREGREREWERDREKMEMWNILFAANDVHLRYFNFILIFCSRLPIFEAGKHETKSGNGVKVAKEKIRACGGTSETTTFCAVCGNLVFVFF